MKALPTSAELREWASDPIKGSEMVPLHKSRLFALADHLDRTCGNCRFKGDNISYSDEDTFKLVATRFFLCKLVEHNGGAAAGHTEFMTAETAKSAEGKGAFVVDGSGYFAALCVEEDFACSKWEPRAAPVVGLTESDIA